MRIAITALLVLAPLPAVADARLADDDTFAIAPHRPFSIAAGVVAGTPAALPTGLATGAGATVTRACTCWLSYGARLAAQTATGSSIAWTVRHDDIQVRGFAMARYVVGRGELGLRLGLGPTVVHESRSRNQSAPGSDIGTSATAVVPAVDIEAVVIVRVAGRWGGVVHAGPTLDRVAGATRAGWVAGLEVAWQL